MHERTAAKIALAFTFFLLFLGAYSRAQVQVGSGGIVVLGGCGGTGTPCAIAQGGTGASTAPAALANLGGWQVPIFVSTPPSGSCAPNNQIYYLTTSVPYPEYICQGGTIVQTGGGGGGGGGGSFSALTGGTNINAAMLVGTGASMGTSGTGTIAATTASALASTPTNCGSSTAPIGVDSHGNAIGCFTPAGSSSVLPAYNPTSIICFGDSITAGAGLTTSSNNYCNQIADYVGLTLPTNNAVSGDQACDSGIKILNSDSPVVTARQPWRSLLIGTNDANNEGAGAYETTFNNCLLADMSLESIPSSYKVAGSTGTTSGTCSNDTTYSQLTGENCTSNGATISLPLTTTGGTIYIWYRSIDSDGGTWTYKVDSGGAVAENTAQVTPIATHNGNTAAPVLVRVTGVAAGSHTILFTKTSAGGNMPILAVGTVPSGIPLASTPYFVMGDLPNQLNGNDQTAVNAYRTDTVNDITTLAGDGLAVYHAPVGTRLQATTAAADMTDVLHPNDAGHLGEIYPAFQTAAKVLTPTAPVIPNNNWHVGTVLSNYTVTSTDAILIASCSGCTITVPTGLPQGQIIEVTNYFGSTVTIQGGSGMNLSGGSVTLYAGNQSIAYEIYNPTGTTANIQWANTPTNFWTIHPGTVNTAYTAQVTDSVIYCSNTSSSVPISLPTGLATGQIVTIVNKGTQPCTIAATGGGSLTGPASVTSGNSFSYQTPDGFNWFGVWGFTGSTTASSIASPLWGGTSTGSGSIQAITVSPAIAAYGAVGLRLVFLPGFSNTITTPTLNVNALGAVTISKCGGQPLAVGDLSTTALADVLYDATVPNFELQNPQTGACGTSYEVLSGNQSTASTSFVTTTLAFPTIPAGATAIGKCHGLWQNSATTDTQSFSLNFSAAPTSWLVSGSMGVALSGTCTSSCSSGTYGAGIGGTTPAVANTNYPFYFDITVVNGASANTVTLYYETSAGTASVQQDSTCNWTVL